MTYPKSRAREIAKRFREGYSRAKIARAYFVSLSTVDRAIRDHVAPGGRKRKKRRV